MEKLQNDKEELLKLRLELTSKNKIREKRKAESPEERSERKND